jgi:hypothetical protein
MFNYSLTINYPLQERYEQAVSYLLREKKQLQEQNLLLSLRPILVDRLVQKKKFRNTTIHFSLSLFPIASGSFTKKLNDRITEEEFSTDILPSIDQMIH